jgi:protein SCO1/2
MTNKLKNKRRLSLPRTVALGLLLVVPMAVAQSPQKQGTLSKRPGAVTVDKIQIEIPDLLVQDHEGIERRFYSDLIKDKVVILNFFFTSCPSFCPTMSLKLAKLQKALGDRLGKDVFFITVTKDPATDTVARLREWRKKFDSKSGWTMITGDVKTIGKIVYDFTGDPLGKDMHNTIFIIGNDKTGNWADLSGFASTEELRQQIDAVATKGFAQEVGKSHPR